MNRPASALQHYNEGAWTDRPLGWFDVVTGPNDMPTIEALVESLQLGLAMHRIRLGPGLYRVIDGTGYVASSRRIHTE